MGNDITICSGQSIRTPHGAHTSFLTPSGDTALNISIKHKYPDILKKLAENKFGINQPESGGDFPIHIAVTEKCLDALKILITHGAKVNVKNGSGLTPLHLACFHGQSQLAEVLLSNGAHPDGVIPGEPNSSVSTPLRLAADNGDYTTVKLLLESGANPDIKDIFGFTLLIRASAVKARCSDLGLLLVDYSHGFGVKDSKGHSAMAWAIYTDQCDLVEHMILKMQSKGIGLPQDESIPPVLLAIHLGCWRCFRNLTTNFGQNALLSVDPSPVEFAILHPYWNVNMMALCGNGLGKRSNVAITNVDRIDFARVILYEFDIELKESFVNFCVNEALRMGKVGHQVVSLCINACGSYGKVTDRDLKLKQEILFETIGKRCDRAVIMKLFCTGFQPNTGNIISIYDYNVRKNKSQELVDEMNIICRNPRTLKNLSVIKVRECLRRNVIYEAKCLNMPSHIYEMLTIGFNKLSVTQEMENPVS